MVLGDLFNVVCYSLNVVLKMGEDEILKGHCRGHLSSGLMHQTQMWMPLTSWHVKQGGSRTLFRVGETKGKPVKGRSG